MPIRPENKIRYPKDWKRISAQIRERSGGQCECEGECGLHRTTPGPRRCREKHLQAATFARGRVVLTVAHLDHQPENCAPINLKAMCQRCHLRYDMKHHARSRRVNRDRETGQGSLL
jgi:hypothetical protein